MAVLSNLGFPFHSALGVSAPLALLGGVVLCLLSVPVAVRMMEKRAG